MRTRAFPDKVKRVNDFVSAHIAQPVPPDHALRRAPQLMQTETCPTKNRPPFASNILA